MKKTILFLIASLFFLFPHLSFSQNETWNLTGNVIDGSTKEALPYVNVVLYSLPDTTFVTGTATDDNGKFSLAATKKAGVLKISMLGYQQTTLKVANEQVGTVSLSPREEMLKEVVIKGSAPLVKMEPNGISADIQHTFLRNMGNLSDVLAQMPFVVKDNDAFTVLGKGTPIFYINNRLVRDNDELQRLNSRDIKKVTVITNPGAEYDASVKAVIKIETLRPQEDGFGGNIWTYNQYNSKWYTRDGIYLDYRKGGLDIFGSFGYADMNFPKKRTKTSEIQTDATSININTISKENDRWEFLQPEIGFDYIVNANQSFGARYQFFKTPAIASDYLMNTNVFLNNALNESLSTVFSGLTAQKSHYVNAYYDGKLSPLFTVRLDMDYKKSDSGADYTANNTYPQGEDSLVNTYNSANSTLYAGRLTVETPIWKGMLSYGLEGSHTLENQALSVVENTGIPGIDASSNQVTQNLAAGFISYSKTFNLFSANAGLRYENVLSDYYQNNVLIAEQSKRYSRLFPSVNLSYGGKKVQMSLGYRNTVNRPTYDNLKSSVFYMAPYAYASGNPLLMPTYTNSLTYMLKWKMFTLMSSYDWNQDYIAGGVPQPYLDDAMIIKPINIPHTQHLAINLNYSSTYGIWHPSWDASVNKDYMELGNPVMTFNKPVLYFNFRNNFNVKGCQLGLNVWLKSKGNEDASYDGNIRWATNLYINKNFFHDKLQVNLSGNDIFDTSSRYLMTFSYNGLTSTWDNYMYKRSIVLELHYNFNVKQNSRYKGKTSTDELKRL